MKQLGFICILLLFANAIYAQGIQKGEMKFGISLGPAMSNLLNSEAPHKINIYGSDLRPVLVTSDDQTKSPAYSNYKTSLVNDVLYSLSASFDFEYALDDNLCLVSGIAYQQKGIDLKYSETIENYRWPGTEMHEIYNLNIKNHYLVIPFTLKKYIFKDKNLFVAGGIYTGYLLASKIDNYHQKVEWLENELVSNYIFEIDQFKDSKKEYTNRFDFGVSFGTGYDRKITNRLELKTNLICNLGLRKVDRKYNNNYYITPAPQGTNFSSYLLRSTNYYGLNSKSKNINLVFRFGLAYRI